MKKFYFCKLCLFVFGVLLTVQSVFASKKEFEGDYICLPIETGGLTFQAGINGAVGRWTSDIHTITRMNLPKAYTVRINDDKSYYKVLNADIEYPFDPALRGANIFMNGDHIFRSYSDGGLFEFNAERRQYVLSKTSGLVAGPYTSNHSNLPDPYVQLGTCSKL